MKSIAVAGIAVVGAPFIEKQLLALMPVTFAGTTTGRWTVKIGTAVATGYAAKMLLGQEASRLAYIVLGANLIADAVAEFMPTLTPGTGYYTQSLGGFGGMGLVTSGMSASGPYTGVTGMAPMPVRPGQDPFTPVF